MKNSLAATLLLLLLIIPFCGRSQSLLNTDSLINVLKKEKDDSTKLGTLQTLSVYFLKNKPAISLDYSKQMLTLAQKLDFKKYIIYSYQNIGAYYYYRNNYALASEYSKKGLEVIRQTKRKSALCGAYCNLSLLAIARYDYPLAINYSDTAFQIAETLKDSVLIGSIYSNKAIIFNNMSDYPTALNYLFKALSINERINNNSNIPNNYYNIGYNYLLNGDYDKALNYFNLSVIASNKVNNRFQLTQTLVKIGEVYKDEKNWNKALDYFKQSITIAKEVGSVENTIASTQNIAMILSEQQKYDEAIQEMLNAFELSYQIDNKEILGINFGYIGQIYMKKKNYTDAISNLLKGIDLFKEIKSKNNQAEILNNLATCYGAINNFKQQANCLVQYQALRDSIFNEETIKKTAETEAKYELDKKGKEIALLTKDKALLTQNKQIQQLEIKKQTFLKNTFIAGSIVLCILLFILYRYFQTRHLLKLQTLRNKIASDLHDDIGSTLSSISVFSLIAREESKEVIPLLEQIGEYSRKMLDSMNDIVWSINPENDDVDKIILRMRAFAYEMMRVKKITYKFSVDESITDLKLSMEVRKNLYLIFKEATNNIVKYAETDSALFSITRSKKTIKMLIRDKGKGFDINNLETQGNGLKNMKTRALDIGAEFLIESEPGQGTTIQLLIKAA